MLGDLIKAAVDTATLPIAAAKDVVTLGGVLNGRKESYTEEKAEDIGEDVENIISDIFGF